MESHNPHTVLVLGAGASLAEAIGHHPKRDGKHPPLDKTFFSRVARRIRAEKHPSARQEILARVVSRAGSLGQPDLCGSGTPVSLEEHLGRLFYDMNSTASTANIEAYYDLVRLYNSELLETTNWMVGRHGNIRRLIDREHRPARLSIVTFNHDLLIENALASLAPARHPGAWCLSHAYGIDFSERIFDPSNQYDSTCPGDADGHIPLFKMHGSCNWVYRTKNVYPSPQVARGNRAIVLWTNKALSQSTQMTMHGGGRSRWHMWPLIVPPVYEKHSYIKGALKHVWDEAGDALRTATRVIFWGYSFPRADLHARYFFAALAHQNAALRAPILINPDPRSQDELWAVLKPTKVSHYKDIDAFLADQ